jgi:hypothetical protein
MAIGLCGFLLSYLIAFWSTIFFLMYCILAVARLVRRSKAFGS